MIRSDGRLLWRQARALGSVASTAALLASLLLVTTAAPGLALDEPVACGVHPLDVVLIIDRSGSMETEQSDGHTRNYWSELAANQLVTDLDGGVGNVGALHRVGLTTFGGTTASVDLALGPSDAASVHAAINGIAADGTTPLKLGMATGAEDLVDSQRAAVDGAPVLQVVVLLSDGRPNPDDQRPDADEIAAYLASADVAYSIAIGEGGSGYSQVDLDLMQDLANPGANARHVADAWDLPGLFADIFTDLTCPQIGIEKTPSVSSLDAPGGAVTYSYAVTNSNPEASLGSVVVGDDKCSPVSYLSGDTNEDGRLQSSETWTFSCSATLSATTTNVATASGEYNGVGFSAQDVATVVVAEPTATPTPTETATPTPTETATPTPAETATNGPVAAPVPSDPPAPSAAPLATPPPEPTPWPVIATVPLPAPTAGSVAEQPVPSSQAPDQLNPVMAVLAAFAAQAGRVVRPEAAVAVAATFGFPLGLSLAVVIFLAVQGRIDGRDPKLVADAPAEGDAVVPFVREEQL